MKRRCWPKEHMERAEMKTIGLICCTEVSLFLFTNLDKLWWKSYFRRNEKEKKMCIDWCLLPSRLSAVLGPLQIASGDVYTELKNLVKTFR